MSQFHTICRRDDVPEGEARRFVVGESQIGVFHIDGEFFALANECPHAGASLARGRIDGDCVTCRIHHWRFRIRDGQYLDAEQPQNNVRTFPVRLLGEEVQVKLDRPISPSRMLG